VDEITTMILSKNSVDSAVIFLLWFLLSELVRDVVNMSELLLIMMTLNVTDIAKNNEI
jgi:hypothetical protein